MKVLPKPSMGTKVDTIVDFRAKYGTIGAWLMVRDFILKAPLRYQPRTGSSTLALSLQVDSRTERPTTGQNSMSVRVQDGRANSRSVWFSDGQGREVCGKGARVSRFVLLDDEVEKVAGALYGALNVEGPATLGATMGAYVGLDVPYHFEKIREALALIDPEGLYA